MPYQPLGVTVAGGLGSPLGDVPIFVAVVNPGTPASEQLKVYSSNIFKYYVNSVYKSMIVFI